MLDKARGARITRRMNELKLTVEALAELCGVGTQAVYKWRRGYNLPSNRVIQLATHLKCTTDFLLLAVENVKGSSAEYLFNKIPLFERELLLAYLRRVYSNKE